MTAPIFQSPDAKSVRRLMDQREGCGAVDEIRVDGRKVTFVSWLNYSLKDGEAVAAECLDLYRNGRRVSGQPLRVVLQSAGLAAYIDWELESANAECFGWPWVVVMWTSDVNPFGLFPHYGKRVVPMERDPAHQDAWRNAVILAEVVNSRSEYGTLLRSLEDQKRRP